ATRNPIGQFHVAYATQICPSAFGGSWKTSLRFAHVLGPGIRLDAPLAALFPRGGERVAEGRALAAPTLAAPAAVAPKRRFGAPRRREAPPRRSGYVRSGGRGAVHGEISLLMASTNSATRNGLPKTSTFGWLAARMTPALSGAPESKSRGVWSPEARNVSRNSTPFIPSSR